VPNGERMAKSSTVIARVDPDKKDRFTKACTLSGISEPDVLRKLIDKYIEDIDPPTIDVDDPNSKNDVPTERRWNTVSTRLTNTEFKEFKELVQKEKGKTISDWLLKMIFAQMKTGPQLRDEEQKALKESIRELRSIGRNLSQLVRAVNIGRADAGQFSEHYAVELIKRIEKTTEAFKALIKSATQRKHDNG